MTETTTEPLPNHCRHCGKAIYTSTKVEHSLAGPGTPYVVRTCLDPRCDANTSLGGAA